MNKKVHNTTPDDAEVARRVSNKSKILTALIEAGTAGVTNAELSQIQLRYGVSINLLVREGHVITNTLIKGGLRRYALAPSSADCQAGISQSISCPEQASMSA